MENIQAKQKKKKGFTLIELIIVMAILGILALIAIPKFGAARKDAKINADFASAKTIANTTAALLASEKIKPEQSPIDLSDTAGAAKIIKDALSNSEQMAKPQAYEDKNFTVTIENGYIKVSVGEAELYPKQEKGKYEELK